MSDVIRLIGHKRYVHTKSKKWMKMNGTPCDPAVALATSFATDLSGAWSWAQLNSLVIAVMWHSRNLTPTQHSKLHDLTSHCESCYVKYVRSSLNPFVWCGCSSIFISAAEFRCDMKRSEDTATCIHSNDGMDRLPQHTVAPSSPFICSTRYEKQSERFLLV